MKASSGVVMKSLVLAGIVGMVGACAFVVGLRATAGQDAADRTEPFVVGRCYRVFPADRDQTYIFKVIGPATGEWLRVQSDPAAPRVPGARPTVPLWLNLRSPFAVQEWSCSE
jgi:hypothetical protein